jgi:preprotein translocase subunit YajC
MQPVKGETRTSVIRKFVLLYSLSLVAIFLVVYFLFNTPAAIFKKSMQQYQHSEMEEGQLLKQIDGITTSVNNTIEADRNYKVAINVADKEKYKEVLGEYTNEISTALTEIENDSTSRKSSFSRRNANNYLFLFRTFLEYRDAFSNDFATLESRKDLPSQFRTALDSLRTYQAQREYLKTQITEANNKNNEIVLQATKNLNADGASKATYEKTIDDLQNKLRQAQTELNNLRQQKAGGAQTSSQTAEANLNDQQMASLLANAGKKIYSQALQGKNFKGGTIEQRAYFACARQIFEDARSHADNDDITTYLKNIDVQLKKLSY